MVNSGQDAHSIDEDPQLNPDYVRNAHCLLLAGHRPHWQTNLAIIDSPESVQVPSLIQFGGSITGKSSEDGGRITTDAERFTYEHGQSGRQRNWTQSE